jgi:hypothetical protein
VLSQQRAAASAWGCRVGPHARCRICLGPDATYEPLVVHSLPHRLEAAKERRQVIIATRSAVLGDAESLIPMYASRSGCRCGAAGRGR